MCAYACILYSCENLDTRSAVLRVCHVNSDFHTVSRSSDESKSGESYTPDILEASITLLDVLWFLLVEFNRFHKWSTTHA